MYKRFIKRIIDIVFALFGIILTIPIFIILAPIIHFTDGGPVFYNAQRIGRNGKLFKMYKFRSMYVNAPDIRNSDGSTYNGDDDPRVTKIGRFMRRTSLDELPQFINVFLGDMSVIGPRPDPPSDMDIYTEEQKIKLIVRPGITGYNQAYFRNSIPQDEKFANDVYYAKNITFLFDVKIFFKTIISVLKSENVYSEVAISDKKNETNKKKILSKKIMILGASILQLPAIQKAKEMGLQIVAVDMNSDAIGFKEEGVVKEVISTIDIPAVVECAKKHRIDGVMTLASDMPMRTVAAVAKEMDLVGI